MSGSISDRIRIMKRINTIKSEIVLLEDATDNASKHQKYRLKKELDQLRHQHRQV